MNILLKNKQNKNIMKKILKLFFFFLFFIIILFYINTLFFSYKILGASSNNNTSDLQLLARAINGEARGESYEGQVAVGAVILNRVNHPDFPNTIAGVIYQPGAFTAVSDGQINVPIDESSTVFKAAQDALNGWDPTNRMCLLF